MTGKPTTPAASRRAPDVMKTSSAAAGTAPKPARWRTWTRIVRYVSLYYPVNVIGIGITVEGFPRLVAAGDDLAARARATGVVAAGSCLRMAAAAVVATLWDTRYNVVMIEFCLVTVAVTLYVHITMDAFGCTCEPCQC